MPSPPWERAPASDPPGRTCRRALGRWSAAMPMPLSLTARPMRRLRCAPPSARCGRRRRVYFAALFSRLRNTCASRVASALRSDRLGRHVRRPARGRAAPISGRLISTARFHDGAQIERAPCAARSLSAADAATRRAGRRRAASGGRPGGRSRRWLPTQLGSRPALMRSTSAALRIGASGLRSSCASVARNSSLRRSASRRASSRRRLSVTSTAAQVMPTGSPAAPRSGSIVRSKQRSRSRIDSHISSRTPLPLSRTARLWAVRAAACEAGKSSPSVLPSIASAGTPSCGL